jgi:hypothetical protein
MPIRKLRLPYFGGSLLNEGIFGEKFIERKIREKNIFEGNVGNLKKNDKF